LIIIFLLIFSLSFFLFLFVSLFKPDSREVLKPTDYSGKKIILKIKSHSRSKGSRAAAEREEKKKMLRVKQAVDRRSLVHVNFIQTLSMS
jgi:hypothetical protein